MFQNMVFLPHQLYHGPFPWAPSTPPREDGKSKNYSPLSSSPSSPCLLKSMSLDSHHDEILEAFRLFWDQEELLLIVHERVHRLDLAQDVDEEVEVE